MRRAGGLALAASVVLTFAGWTSPATADTPPLSGVPVTTALAGKSYVALGDSFTADWGVDPVATDQPSTGCRQSANDYPHQVAASLGLALRDASCAGAVTANMTSPQTEFPSAGPFPAATPQFDALSADTDIVTIGIGGNDFGFADVAAACALDPVTGYVLGGSDWPFGTFLTNCKAYYDPDGTPGGDQLEKRIKVVAPRVAATVTAVAKRSPHAKIFFVDYLALSPDAASAPDPSTYPDSCYRSLLYSNAFPFSGIDTVYLAQEQKSFNDAIDAAAAGAGASVIRTYAESLSHTPCAGTVDQWVNGITVSVFSDPARRTSIPTTTRATAASGRTTPAGTNRTAGSSTGQADASTSATTPSAATHSAAGVPGLTTAGATTSGPPGPGRGTTASAGRTSTGGTPPDVSSPAAAKPAPQPQASAAVAVGSLHPNLEGAVHQSETVIRALVQALGEPAPPGTTASTTTSSTTTSSTTASSITTSSTTTAATATPTSHTTSHPTRPTTHRSTAPVTTSVPSSGTSDGSGVDPGSSSSSSSSDDYSYPDPSSGYPAGGGTPPDLAATGPAPIGALTAGGALGLSLGLLLLALGSRSRVRRRVVPRAH